ncbi:MAG TPA: hypothetical protein VMH33_04810 [Solirubrobacterales bacterium]|nr:hypothetical protein [Solirubrobacterales bacterium]
MDKDTGAGFDAEEFEQLLREVRWALTRALRDLYRLHDGDAEAVGQEMVSLHADAAERAAEPIVIRVETFGAAVLVTLREYVVDYVQDWAVGLEEAWTVLAEAPDPLVCNADESIRDPRLLQLHTALDEDLLRAEIERLEGEQPE